MDYRHYESGFVFTQVKKATFGSQYSCYVSHESMTYQRGLGYPSPRLQYFSLIGESYLIVHARNRRVAERKVRKVLRKYHRKNIL